MGVALVGCKFAIFLGVLLYLLGVGEAACAEEITQQSVLKEEPAYRRYETVYTERERERHKEYISY